MHFEHYQLTLFDRPNETVSVHLNEKGGKALQKERRKLYIVYHQKQIFYVGEANSSILIRFQRNCTSFNHLKTKGHARNGYSGYKWLCKEKNPQRNLQIFTIVFDEKLDENRNFVEAVEGELVFLIRESQNYWPRFQHEIHFRNEPGALETAREIVSELFTKLNIP